MVLIRAKTNILQLYKKFKNFVTKERHLGDLSAPKATLDSRLLSSLSYLLKERKHVRIKNSQNHFKSMFGSSYFISKNNEIKLAKTTNRGTKESKLSLGSWLAVCEAN